MPWPSNRVALPTSSRSIAEPGSQIGGSERPSHAHKKRPGQSWKRLRSSGELRSRAGNGLVPVDLASGVGAVVPVAHPDLARVPVGDWRAADVSGSCRVVVLAVAHVAA